MKFIHIGLGKCGTTTLQNYIFPEIAKRISANYIDIHDYINWKKIKNHYFENMTNFSDKLPKKFIISNELLYSYSWEFSFIRDSFELMKKNFPSDTIIMITIRNPLNLLNSIFIEKNIHELRGLSPQKFFYNSSSYIEKKGRYNKYFNLNNFSYLRLINLYKSYFHTVKVIKFENKEYINEVYRTFNLKNGKEIISYINTNKSIKNEKTIKLFLKIYKIFPLFQINNFLKKRMTRANLFQYFLYRIMSLHERFFGSKKNFKIEKLPINIEKILDEYKNLKV